MTPYEHLLNGIAFIQGDEEDLVGDELLLEGLRILG